MRKTRLDTTGNVLPTGVYYKHGAYYLVRRATWLRLCTEYRDLAQALSATRGDSAGWIPSESGWLLKFMRRLYARSKNAAPGRRIAFNLEFSDVMALLVESDYRCAVTRRHFSPIKINGVMPYAPSIDRRDSSKDYSKNNCRIVCVAANYAMNVWGEDVMNDLLYGTQKLSKRSRKIVDDYEHFFD